MKRVTFVNTSVASADTIFYTLYFFSLGKKRKRNVKTLLSILWTHAKIFTKYLNLPWWNENYVILSLLSSINLPERQRAFEKANFSRMVSSKSSSEFNMISPLCSFDGPLYKGKKKDLLNCDKHFFSLEKSHNLSRSFLKLVSRVLQMF